MVKTAVSGKVTMRYITFGSGEKPMVILPGLSLRSVMESDAAVCSAYNMFASEYTVYLFDRKENIEGFYTIEQMADDTALIMQSLGIKDACIFGASQGGMIAMSLAGRYPALAKKLYIGSSAVRSNAVLADTAREWMTLALKRDIPALAKSAAVRIFSPRTLENCLDYIVNMYSGITDEELDRFTVLASACADFDISDDVRNIKCPVLAVSSEGDRVVTPEAAKELASLCGAQVYMYGSEYGHGVYDEARDYKKRIYDFFDAEQ